MNICLIWNFGAIGASIGTVVAELTVTLVQMYFVRNDFNIKKIARLSRNYIIASIVMFIVCLVVGKIVNDNFISVVAQITIGGLIYGVCLLILKDEFIKEILNKIKMKIKI